MALLAFSLFTLLASAFAFAPETEITEVPEGYHSDFKAYEAELTALPGTGEAAGVSGSVAIFVRKALDTDDYNLYVKAHLYSYGSLECNGTVCGAHLHSGTGCDNTTVQGGHYLNDEELDPWDGTGYRDADYVAGGVEHYVTFPVIGRDEDGPRLSASYVDSIKGKPFVIHTGDGSGTRVACGVMQEKTFETYVATPSYNNIVDLQSESTGVTGTVYVHQMVDSRFLMVSGSVNGLEDVEIEVPQSSGVGGAHVHTGISCDNSTTQGGHYYAGAKSYPYGIDVSDPWDSTTYMGSEELTLEILQDLDDTITGDSIYMDDPNTFAFPIYTTQYVPTYPAGSQAPIELVDDSGAGKAFIYHGAGGARVACGLFERMKATPIA